jgi:heptosyltransferase-1
MTPPRIGIVKLSSLGDVVHTLPLATALRRAFPDARLIWVVEAREAEILRRHPALDGLVVVDTRGWRRAFHSPRSMGRAGRDLMAARRALMGERLDVVIDAQGLVKSGLFVAMTGAARRIGFVPERCRERASALFTNARVTPPAGARHIVEQNLALLRPLGLSEMKPEFALPVDGAAERRIGEWLAARGISSCRSLIVLNPGAGRPEKRWPADRFQAVARGLADVAADLVVTWGPDEQLLAQTLRNGTGTRVHVAPPTDLTSLVTLLRRARLMVAGDTGPLHVAAALGVRCLGLFGPTPAERNGPYGRQHRVLRSPDGSMEGVTVAAVLAAAREMIDAA